MTKEPSMTPSEFEVLFLEAQPFSVNRRLIEVYRRLYEQNRELIAAAKREIEELKKTNTPYASLCLKLEQQLEESRESFDDCFQDASDLTVKLAAANERIQDLEKDDSLLSFNREKHRLETKIAQLQQIVVETERRYDQEGK